MQLICPQASAPVVRGNNRTMDRRCARERCSRIAGICSDAEHASDSPPCGCVTASWMFCVLGLPWQAAIKAYFEQENNVEAQKCSRHSERSRGAAQRTKSGSFESALLRSGCQRLYLNGLTSAYPAHSNPIYVLCRAPRSLTVSLCRHGCRPYHSVDALVGRARDPRG
jgi:hypothetical protein